APYSASGDGTGPTVTLAGNGLHTFPANLVIRAGDYVGIDSSVTSSFSRASDACGPGSFSARWHPPLVDFAPLVVGGSNIICELLVNAEVVPSTTVNINDQKNQKYKVAKGKIILPIELPGPGGLKISGNGVAGLAAASKVGTFTQTVGAA